MPLGGELSGGAPGDIGLSLGWRTVTGGNARGDRGPACGLGEGVLGRGKSVECEGERSASEKRRWWRRGRGQAQTEDTRVGGGRAQGHPAAPAPPEARAFRGLECSRMQCAT